MKTPLCNFLLYNFTLFNQLIFTTVHFYEKCQIDRQFRHFWVSNLKLLGKFQILTVCRRMKRTVKNSPKSQLYLFHFGSFLVKNFLHTVSCNTNRTAVQVNFFQKRLFLYQLTHNMTKDCSLNYEFSTWKFQAKNKMRTCWEHVAYTNWFFVFVLTFRTIYVFNMFWAWHFYVLKS
jgi:hypothetical protein